MAVHDGASMNVLRITHKQLSELSKCPTSDDANGLDKHNKKDVKRPAQELYRPGMGRLQKSPKQMQTRRSHGTLSSSPKSCMNPEYSSSSSSQISFNSRDHNHPIDLASVTDSLDQVMFSQESFEGDKGKDRNRGKRPDQVIYVPRSKSSADPSSTCNQDGTLSDGPVESMIITNSNMANFPTGRPPKSQQISVDTTNQNKDFDGKSRGSKSKDSERRNSRSNSSRQKSDGRRNSISDDNHSHRNRRNSGPRRHVDRSPVGRSNKSQKSSIRDLEENWDLEVRPTAKLSRHFSQEDLRNSKRVDEHSDEAEQEEKLLSMNWGEVVEAEEKAREERAINPSPEQPQAGNCDRRTEIVDRKSPPGIGPRDQSKSGKMNSSKEKSAPESNRSRRRQKSGSSKRDGRVAQSTPHRETYELPPRFERQKQLAKLQQMERRQSHSQTDSSKEGTNEGRSTGLIKISTDAQHTSTGGYGVAPSTSPRAPDVMHRQLFNPNHPNTPTQVMVVKTARDAEYSNGHNDDEIPLQHRLTYSGPPVPQTSAAAYGQQQMFQSGYPPQHQMIFNHVHPPTLPTPHPMMPSHWSARTAQAIGKNMREAMTFEHDLNMMLSRGLHVTDFNSIRQCIWKIQVRYETVILADPEFCTRQNVEQMLWKAAFYQLIEALRRVMSDDPSYVDDAKNKLLKVIEEGTVFYESLLEKQQESFGFTLSEFLDYEAVRPRSLPPIVKLALVSAQKTLICLGDLARYKEQANGTTNFGRARNWYMKAQQIAPKNGRPYNQLAILALYARRKLDAVYYYIRSLAASNPFLTARESLLSLFDDARKKYEQVARKQAEKVLASSKEQQENEVLKDKQTRMERLQIRTEVWIRPDGSTSKCEQSNRPADDKNDVPDEFAHMSTVDLNKRFVLSFLHVHGKLFTKIGMETLNDAAVDMLKQFRALLSRTPTPVGSTRLLQLMAINMFAISNSSLKDTSLEASCRSAVQQQALQVSLEMLASFLERCVVLLRQHMRSDQYPTPYLFCDDLQQLVPAVKVWMDWMICHQDVWMPPPPISSSDIKSGSSSDVWQLLAETLTVIRTINMDHIQLVHEDDHDGASGDTEVVVLTEDTSLAGFVPLMAAPENFVRVRMPADKEQARNALRVNKLQFFGDYLCGVSPPILTYDVERECYFSAVTDTLDRSDSSPLTDSRSEFSEEDGNDEDGGQTSSDEEELHDNCNEIQRLWSRKEKLRKAKARQEKHNAHLQAVLEEHGSRQAIQLWIVPRLLIADTNTYIDHIARIASLVDTGHFQLLVPLVVLGELDGLAKGQKPTTLSRPAGAAVTENDVYKSKVGDNASSALSYLESKFSKRDSHVKAITSRGSILDTIAFRSEDSADSQMTNDDIILNCCLHLCKKDDVDNADDNDDSNTNSQGSKKISRQVVLLTDDRNLRVKAHSQDVPARDFASFASWACVT